MLTYSATVTVICLTDGANITNKQAAFRHNQFPTSTYVLTRVGLIVNNFNNSGDFFPIIKTILPILQIQ